MEYAVSVFGNIDDVLSMDDKILQSILSKCTFIESNVSHRCGSVFLRRVRVASILRSDDRRKDILFAIGEFTSYLKTSSPRELFLYPSTSSCPLVYTDTCQGDAHMGIGGVLYIDGHIFYFGYRLSAAMVVALKKKASERFICVAELILSPL